MGQLIDVAVIAGWLSICAIWAGLLVAQFRARRGGLFLKADSDGPRHGDAGHPSPPTVCVVIPARNEGRQIERCNCVLTPGSARPGHRSDGYSLKLLDKIFSTR